MAVARGLEQGDDVFACSLIFPHLCGRCANFSQLTPSPLFDAFTDCIMLNTALFDGRFDISVFNRLGRDFNYEFVSSVDVFHLEGDFNEFFLIFFMLDVLSSQRLCFLRFSGLDFCEFAFS